MDGLKKSVMFAFLSIAATKDAKRNRVSDGNVHAKSHAVFERS